MKKLLMTAAVAAVALGLGSTASLAEAYKACWIYVGPVGDGGWSFQHDEGRKAVVAELGDKLKPCSLRTWRNRIPTAPSSVWHATAAR